jgi:serine/threonine protein kinase
VLAKEKRFTEDRARIYAAEVLLALQELHSKNIIFRDLKPENIVLDREGHARLTDFGLAKEGIKDNVSSKSFCGTGAYLAPEMLRKKGHGKAIDWYLYGAFIHKMLTGKIPYFADDRETLYKNIERGSLSLPKYLSADARSLITGLLNKNPEKRLGGREDAEEIKRHPWFAGIDWEVAENRGLKPPKPEVREVREELLGLELFEDNYNQINNLEGWEYTNGDAI